LTPIAFGWGMMNQLTQDVDGQGRVHVMLWHNPPNAPGPNHDLNAWRYFHYGRDEIGRWHRQTLPFFGRKPWLVVNEAGDALHVFNKGTDLEYHQQDHGGKFHVAAATAKEQWTDPVSICPTRGVDSLIATPRRNCITRNAKMTGDPVGRQRRKGYPPQSEYGPRGVSTRRSPSMRPKRSPRVMYVLPPRTSLTG